jgi:hypothetical protein
MNFISGVKILPYEEGNLNTPADLSFRRTVFTTISISVTSIPSFPSALQLRVSFGLLNTQPPFLSVLHLFRRRSVGWYNEEVRRMWIEEVVAHLFSLISHSFNPSEADYLVAEQFSFYGVRLSVSRPTSNLEDQGIPLHLAPTP